MPAFTIALRAEHVCTADTRMWFQLAAICVIGLPLTLCTCGPTSLSTGRTGLGTNTSYAGWPAHMSVIPVSGHAIGSRLRDTGGVSTDERLRCVIVDDNIDFLIAAARLLARQGIAVVGVGQSISDGLRCIENAKPEVILVDIDLGPENGFDLVEQLHRNRPAVGAPVILISTHAEEDFAEMVAASSAVAFLPKSALSGSAIREALGMPE